MSQICLCFWIWCFGHWDLLSASFTSCRISCFEFRIYQKSIRRQSLWFHGTTFENDGALTPGCVSTIHKLFDLYPLLSFTWRPLHNSFERPWSHLAHLGLGTAPCQHLTPTPRFGVIHGSNWKVRARQRITSLFRISASGYLCPIFIPWPRPGL